MKYKYIFLHKATGVKLVCSAESDQEAIMLLGKLCQTVMDWQMRKYRPSKNQRKKLKRKSNEKANKTD